MRSPPQTSWTCPNWRRSRTLWHTREDYEDFVRVYGYDIMTWSGYPVMKAVREFLMVTWMTQKASESEPAAAESAKRIAALRTGASRKDWQPY